MPDGITSISHKPGFLYYSKASGFDITYSSVAFPRLASIAANSFGAINSIKIIGQNYIQLDIYSGILYLSLINLTLKKRWFTNCAGSQ